MTDRGEKDFFELLFALRDWPRMPSAYMLHQIGGVCGEYPADWERGKKIQNELPFEEIDRIPFTVECEKGAGFWDRITGGAWRDCSHPTRPSTDIEEPGKPHD